MFCNDDCAIVPVALPAAGCDIITRAGGITRVIFAKCNIDIDISDLTAWQTAIDAGDIVATGEVLGAKSKGSFQKKKLSSRNPEAVTGVTRNIQITDSGVYTEAYAFWQDKDTNAPKFVVAYIDSIDNVTGFFPYVMELDDVIPEDVNDNVVFDSVISYNQRNMPVPVNVPGLTSILK